MRNRLKFSRNYLVGPMDHNRDVGRIWRTSLSMWLLERLQSISFDPYNKPLLDLQNAGLEDDDNYIKRKEAIARLDRVEAYRLTKPVVHTDLRIVDNVDFIIAFLDIENRPCGTYDEIFMGDNQNKPIIVNCPQGIHNIPDWLWGRLDPRLFFDSWDDVKAYLEHIAFDDEIDCLDRWKFFDIEDRILDIVRQEYTLIPRTYPHDS